MEDQKTKSAEGRFACLAFKHPRGLISFYTTIQSSKGIFSRGGHISLHCVKVTLKWWNPSARFEPHNPEKMHSYCDIGETSLWFWWVSVCEVLQQSSTIWVKKGCRTTRLHHPLCWISKYQLIIIQHNSCQMFS